MGTAFRINCAANQKDRDASRFYQNGCGSEALYQVVNDEIGVHAGERAALNEIFGISIKLDGKVKYPTFKHSSVHPPPENSARETALRSLPQAAMQATIRL